MKKEREIKGLLWIPIILLGIIIALLTFVVAARLSTPEDTWICRDGEWMEHGKPSASKPTLECKKTESNDSKESRDNTSNSDIASINPLDKTHDVLNALPDENPIGPIEIDGFFSFMAPVFDIMADLGGKICEWGRPPEIAGNCDSIKVGFQEFLNR